MLASSGQQTPHKSENPLAYLPHKRTVEYARNQVIYDQQRPSIGLFQIIAGRVKVTGTIEDGSETVIGIFHANEFFGEGGLLGNSVTHEEYATALEKTVLISWSTAEIEAQIERQPKLGTALIQLVAGRCIDCKQRLESFAFDNTTERIVVALLRLARLGTREADGAIRIPPLTHHVLAGYAGTSREMVTAELNNLRRRGLAQYSRKAIEIYPERLLEDLQKRRVSKHPEVS